MPTAGKDGIDPADTPVVQWTNLRVRDGWGGRLLSGLDLTLNPGTAVHLFADNPSDAHLLMRCLATLDWPSRGTYCFDGATLPFTWYEKLLPVKRRIGYLYPTAAMVRNRTVEENLDYQAHYFSDTNLDRHQGVKEALVKGFGIERTLSLCPELIDAMEQRRAIVVRDLLKEPLLFLAEYPEEFVGRGYLALFISEIRKILLRGGVFIFTTNYRGFGKELSPLNLHLENGTLVKELAP
ncbi:hypothetical protein [Desulfoluna sp.]|uniref:hypothetical protein n=1 Tax=Desulfoluna sp. TaxID=2045199 RepID=UPI0026308E75|nr:hypothetical protein [Desulfoluna sp.]